MNLISIPLKSYRRIIQNLRKMSESLASEQEIFVYGVFIITVGAD